MAVIKMKNGDKWLNVFCGYSKEPPTAINVDVTSGDKAPNIALETSNTEYRYLYASGIRSLTLTTTETPTSNSEAFYSFVFISGTTPTIINNTLNAFFKGDDCVNGIFTPMDTKTYEMYLWWNGLSWNAVVRGI